jgi:hypothetical protein
MHIFAKFAFGGPPAAQCLSFGWPPARCKFHSVGRKPDANCNKLQYKIPKFIKSLHVAGDQPNEICTQLAANLM